MCLRGLCVREHVYLLLFAVSDTSVSAFAQVLELVCTREAGAVFEAGGLSCVLSFVRDNGSLIHKDTLHSAMSVVSRLCTKMEPQDGALPCCVDSLSTLLKHDDQHVSTAAGWSGGCSWALEELEMWSTGTVDGGALGGWKRWDENGMWGECLQNPLH